MVISVIPRATPPRKPRLAQLRRGAQDARMAGKSGVVDQRAVRFHLLACVCQLRPGLQQDIACVPQFLGRDGAGAGQALTTGEVLLRAGKVCVLHGNRRGEGAVGAEQRAHLAHRFRQIRLRPFERQPRVGVIDLDQRLSGLHEVGVVGENAHDGAGNLRHHRNDVARDIGIVG
jgi:hypothetical protein